MGVTFVGLVYPAQPSVADSTGRPWYVGVNMAGAEFGKRRYPGKINKDYVYPKNKHIDYFLDRGFNTFRLPFRWERLEPKLGRDFQPAELSRIDKVISHVTGKGGNLILGPHNYARYFGKRIGSKEVSVAAFAAFWARLASRYRKNPGVIFGLMNEPFKFPADGWRRAVERAIRTIRTTGARNLILVPGTNWTGAHSWLSSRKGISNAVAFRTLSDPAMNFAFEVHQYFDGNSSGTRPTCQSEAIGEERLKKFTQWIRDNNHRGFLGEFEAANNAVCLEALDRMLHYVGANSDVWIGRRFWAAGVWRGKYMFSAHPSRGGKQAANEGTQKAHRSSLICASELPTINPSNNAAGMYLRQCPRFACGRIALLSLDPLA